MRIPPLHPLYFVRTLLRSDSHTVGAECRCVSRNLAAAAAAVPSDFNVLPPDEGKPGQRPAIIEAYDETGFTIGGLDYPGPVVCLGKQLALNWRGVHRAQDMTPDSLSILELIRPGPELLLVGTGESPASDMLPKETKEYLADLGIKVDVQSTRHAAATHNFLGEEGRNIATVLLLPGVRHPR